jgi:hypothetical protein
LAGRPRLVAFAGSTGFPGFVELVGLVEPARRFESAAPAEGSATAVPATAGLLGLAGSAGQTRQGKSMAEPVELVGLQLVVSLHELGKGRMMPVPDWPVDLEPLPVGPLEETEPCADEFG